jgi:ADP-heptose:LPS heptosyltransferase
MVDLGPNAGLAHQLAFAKTLRSQNYHAAITLYSTTRMGLLLVLAGIPYRLAPATKLAQLFYHRRIKQRRSQSVKPESVYNQELVHQYLQDNGITKIHDPMPPFLIFDGQEIARLKHEFCQQHGINEKQSLVFIHPGSGGSANNLSLNQYAELGKNLISQHGHHIVISAGPTEAKQANALSVSLGDTPHTVYLSTEGLQHFARHIAFADLFISGSTGPLHIAGALDRRTAAFYTRRRSATALRWQTINHDTHRLAFSPPENAQEEDMSSIDISTAARDISRQFLLS